MYEPPPQYSTLVVFEAQFVRQGIQPTNFVHKTLLLAESEWVADTLWVNPLCFTGSLKLCGAHCKCSLRI